tara:strand:+ start:430 stop:801 length:372 start_codon:yes stop_codon:yes gene_type:complete
MGGISNFVNVNNIGITSVRSRKQSELADLIVERVRMQSDISNLSKIQKELTNMWRSIKVNKTNFDKLTKQQQTKRYNNATKTINQLENQRNRVSQLIDNRNKKLKKIKKKIENVRKYIRYYST